MDRWKTIWLAFTGQPDETTAQVRAEVEAQKARLDLVERKVDGLEYAIRALTEGRGE